LSLSTWGVCSFSGLRGYWQAVRRLRSIAIKNGIHRIHCARCLPEGLMALALRSCMVIPYICYAHGEELNYAEASRELKWLARRVLKRADCVIANSQNTKSILTERWRLSAEQVEILHPGVDSDRFVPAARDLNVRSSLGWGNRPVLLTVGRLQKRK